MEVEVMLGPAWHRASVPCLLLCQACDLEGDWVQLCWMRRRATASGRR